MFIPNTGVNGRRELTTDNFFTADSEDDLVIESDGLSVTVAGIFFTLFVALIGPEDRSILENTSSSSALVAETS